MTDPGATTKTTKLAGTMGGFGCVSKAVGLAAPKPAVGR